MEVANRKLEQEISRRRGTETHVDAPLRRRITFALIVALVLTLLIGVFVWRGAWREQSDTSWVAHTYAAMDSIEIISKNSCQRQPPAVQASNQCEPVPQVQKICNLRGCCE